LGEQAIYNDVIIEAMREVFELRDHAFEIFVNDIKNATEWSLIIEGDIPEMEF
jgi:hypothetical protein